MKSYLEHKHEINQMFNAPRHRKLKRLAFAIIALVIATEMSMIIWLDDIPHRTFLFMQGCVGVGAIVFVILVAIWTYRVYSEYFRGK